MSDRQVVQQRPLPFGNGLKVTKTVKLRNASRIIAMGTEIVVYRMLRAGRSDFVMAVFVVVIGSIAAFMATVPYTPGGTKQRDDTGQTYQVFHIRMNQMVNRLWVRLNRHSGRLSRQRV